ncbi:hypothetical protein AKG95_06890 [Janthinobacterium lividum]|uniref:Uncharacterized protein n=1 Tax=Janthinobacterium lividum TaxID=29581 RepID=A0A1S1UAE7_9BURK|nr:hypothetical protein [Janthinobacterium lividum]OHV97029.1 hypothetical protein AKG95_06890 [Janthinobacterium lividum]
MKKKQKWAVETALTARAVSGRPIAAMMDMGGTPRANAALTMVMMTAAGSSLGAPEGRAYASAISAQLLKAAAAGGFDSTEEYLSLFRANEMTPRLQELAADAVRAIGGAAEFFAMLELATTPAELMGGAQ